MKKGDCNTCSKKATCKELCPEAEAYVNQDTVPEQAESKVFKIAFESTITMSDFNDISDRKQEEIIYYFEQLQEMPNNVEKVIMSCVFVGMPIERIAKFIKMSERNVYILLEKFHK